MQKKSAKNLRIRKEDKAMSEENQGVRENQRELWYERKMKRI